MTQWGGGTFLDFGLQTEGQKRWKHYLHHISYERGKNKTASIQFVLLTNPRLSHYCILVLSYRLPLFSLQTYDADFSPSKIHLHAKQRHVGLMQVFTPNNKGEIWREPLSKYVTMYHSLRQRAKYKNVQVCTQCTCWLVGSSSMSGLECFF